MSYRGPSSAAHTARRISSGHKVFPQNQFHSPLEADSKAPPKGLVQGPVQRYSIAAAQRPRLHEQPGPDTQLQIHRNNQINGISSVESQANMPPPPFALKESPMTMTKVQAVGLASSDACAPGCSETFDRFTASLDRVYRHWAVQGVLMLSLVWCLFAADVYTMLNIADSGNDFLYGSLAFTFCAFALEVLSAYRHDPRHGLL